MTAAYRLKGIGWFAVVVGVALAFYLVSLRVAAERKRLDAVDLRVAAAMRDIRALETEFDTRANLAQLEKWNGDALALAAPTAGQFVRDDAALASVDPNGGPGGVTMQTAAQVVPSQPQLQPVLVDSAPAAAPVAPAPAVVRVAMRVAPAPAPAAPKPVRAAAIDAAVPSGKTAPMLARLAEAERGRAAVAKVRPDAVAMLDRKLLSDNTFGALMAGARVESRRR